MGNYYVGVTGTNVICNETHFDGYITAYPIGEPGNISFYSDVASKQPLDKPAFEKWAREKVASILSRDPDAKFTFFNRSIEPICAGLSDEHISGHNDWDLLKYLNNKYESRDMVQKRDVPVLDYLHCTGDKITYDALVKYFGAKNFVIQKLFGAGGLGTYFVTSDAELKNLHLSADELVSVSAYVDNLPINSTLMISSKNVYELPISVQLIKNTGNFEYMGGDFEIANRLTSKIKSGVHAYNQSIGRELQLMGYRGICGVDYIVLPDGKIKFMELNPRYQGSSFLLSMALKKYGTSIAKMNADCFGSDSMVVPSFEVHRSFINCLRDDDGIILGRPSEIIKKVEGSTFRKIYDESILARDNFEKPDDVSSIIL